VKAIIVVPIKWLPLIGQASTAPMNGADAKMTCRVRLRRGERR
jgi:hypothetical protein